MFCPYCGYDKVTFTDEHVVPTALGGNVTPTNPFKLPVCKDCNNACGRWIDGPFIRSHLIHNARAQAGNAFFDLAADPVVPLFFMGLLPDWKDETTLCDFWLGPTGDAIYHFHRPYSDDLTIVGRPPHLKEADLDAGAVYVAIVASNPSWHPIIMRSVAATFRGASIHYLNVAPPGGTPPHPPVIPGRRHELDWIRGLDGGMRNVRTAMRLDVGDRFLAKVALGMGAIVLGDSFVRSTDADLLRKYLWARDPSERSTIAMPRRGFLASDNRVGMVTTRKGCHTLLMLPTPNGLALNVTFYGTHEATSMVTSNPEHWKGRISDGLVWSIAPGLRRCVAYSTLSSFVADLGGTGNGQPMGALGELLSAIDASPRAPAFHVAEATSGRPPAPAGPARASRHRKGRRVRRWRIIIKNRG